MITPLVCPLCSSRITKLKIIANFVYGDNSKKKKFYFCQTCKINFLYPKLSKKQETIFYNKEFEKFMDTRAGKKASWMNASQHVKSNQETYKRRLSYIKPFLKKSSEVLEIGCSSGFMLYPLKKKVSKVVGIEPSGVFNNYLKKNNILTFKNIRELKYSYKKKFDLIMHFFVLEHVSNPIKFLKEQLSLLKNGGMIIFEVPNSKDALNKLYKIPEFDKFYWSVAHHWYFEKPSLNYCLKKLGKKFKIKLDQRYDLSNHVNWIINGKPGGMKKYTYIFGNKLEQSYKNFLIKTGYCDTLIGIIHK